MEVVTVVVDTVETVESDASELFPDAAVFPHASNANTAVQANTEITAFFMFSISFLNFARTLVILLFYRSPPGCQSPSIISLLFSLFV